MRKNLSRLWLHTVLNLFIVLIVTAVVIPSALYYLIDHQIVTLPDRGRLMPAPILFVLIISLVLGTVTSARILHNRIRPLFLLSRAMSNVAGGDFSIRLDEAKYKHEIKHMFQDFNSMVHELSGIETFRNDFIANVSHEFKTPLEKR